MNLHDNRNVVRDDRLRKEWATNRHYCYLCGGSRFQAWVQTAHIFGGAMRSDEPCNLLRLCVHCHMRDHDGWGERKLTLAHKLWLKKKYDPEEYDEERLLELSCRVSLPEPEQPKV